MRANTYKMKDLIAKIKTTLEKEGVNSVKLIEQLKELREYIKSNLKEPSYVKMVRLAYEDIEANEDYTFLFIEEEDGKYNLAYFLDLLADCGNKYNREELQEIRNLMEGIEVDAEEGE